MSQGLTYYHQCPQTCALCHRFGWRLQDLPLDAHLSLIITVTTALRDDVCLQAADPVPEFKELESREAYGDALKALSGADEPTRSDLANVLHGLAALLHG